MAAPFHFLLTPSQLILLKNILKKLVPRYRNPVAIDQTNYGYGGQPMRTEHFQRITEQIQGEMAWMHTEEMRTRFVANCAAGEWGGTEQFYDLSLESQNTRPSSFQR